MARSDILDLAATHPSIEFADGETVIADGDANTALFVQASGSLEDY